MANKIYKYSNLYSTSSTTAPNVNSMVAGEIALGFVEGEEKLWAHNGTEVINFGDAIGGFIGDEKTVHKKKITSGANIGKKEFSTLLRMKKVTSADTAEWALIPSNVKERFKLVDANGDNIMIESGATPAITADTYSEYIDIYKESSIAEIYVGTKYDEVNSGTGVVTKYNVGDVVEDPDTHQPHTIVLEDFQYLIYVYIDANGDYNMTKINLNDFITEQEFASGVTFDTVENKVRGQLNAAQDLLVTEWTDGDYTNAGVSALTDSGLTLDEYGFNLENIQDAIDAKHANVIKMNGFATGGTEDLFEILSGDTIAKAIMKIDRKVVSNGDGISNDGTSIEMNNTGLIFKDGGADIVWLGAGQY